MGKCQEIKLSGKIRKWIIWGIKGIEKDKWAKESGNGSKKLRESSVTLYVGHVCCLYKFCLY